MTMTRLTRLRKEARQIGWVIRALHKPVTVHGVGLVRYILWDRMGDLYCGSLDELERNIRRGMRYGGNGQWQGFVP